MKIYDDDYGCEGVPDGQELMCSVLVKDAVGNEKWIKLSDSYLRENNLDVGNEIEIQNSCSEIIDSFNP
jgi:hypothetical protein